MTEHVIFSFGEFTAVGAIINSRKFRTYDLFFLFFL